MENDKKVIKTKVQTSVGNIQLYNPNTNQLEDFAVIDKNIEQDYNFHKIWLQDVLNVLDSFGNKKILVLSYLLKIMRNEDNTFSGTYREIAGSIDVSVKTVNVVFSELIESNIIKKISTATYRFNPDIIVKGKSAKRKNLLIRYNYQDGDRDNSKSINNAKNISELINQIEPVNPNQTYLNVDENGEFEIKKHSDND
jgi:DNA-binding transcriptional regulator YhcF (GntR family)